MFAAEIRPKRVSGMRCSRWRWHLDEVFVRIEGHRTADYVPWIAPAKNTAKATRL